MINQNVDKDATSYMAIAQNQTNVSVDQAILGHCVINVYFILAVFTGIALNHGNASVIEIGEEFYVIKI